MIVQPLKILALIFLYFVSCAKAADSEQSEIHLTFDIPFYVRDAYVNLYHPASKKLFKYRISCKTEVASFTRKVLVPNEVSGRCHLFIEWEPQTLGSQHYEIVCETGKTIKLSVRQNGTAFKVKLPETIASKTQSIDYVFRIFRLTSNGIDPYFAVQREVRQLNGETTAEFGMIGAIKGNYILTFGELNSDIPLYYTKFALKAVDSNEWVDVELGEKNTFDGIAAPFATVRHGWWSSVWDVDDKGELWKIEEGPAKGK